MTCVALISWVTAGVANTDWHLPSSSPTSQQKRGCLPSCCYCCCYTLQVACGSRHSVALAASGRVFSWGFNKYSQCCTVVLPHCRETTESLQYAGNEASSSSSGVRNRPQPQDDVPAPHMVLLPESVWLAEQVVSQSGQPVGPNAVGVHHTKQHTADAEEDEDCKLQIMQAVGVQAGGWHTLIEVQVRQVMQQ